MYTLSFSKITQNVIYLFPEIDSPVHSEFIIYTCIHSPPIILLPVNFQQKITICSSRILTMSFSGTNIKIISHATATHFRHKIM